MKELEPFVTAATKFEVAKMYLGTLWKEVFWRRETEQKVATWTIGLFAALLALFYGKDTKLNETVRWGAVALVVFLGSCSVAYLYENWRKNKEISRIIVRLHLSLGAWKKGYLVDDQEPLFPEGWKKWGEESRFFHGHITLLYCVLVFLSTLVCCLSILSGEV